MNGSRTGVQACTADDVAEKLGVYQDDVYSAPNGRVFRDGAIVDVAEVLLEAQPRMADLKQVIGYSTNEMVKGFPESALSNWFIDVLMADTEKRVGKKVSLGITNFGGIRVDMPEGDVLKDDIVSMFPFRNYLCYLELKGSDVRLLLERMAERGWQVVGGARCVVQDRKLVSAELDGKPLDDDKVYGVCTISYLLNGGDGLNIARNARKLVEMKDVMIIDVMLPHVEALTAAGEPIEYQTDGRIKFLDSEGNEIKRD